MSQVTIKDPDQLKEFEDLYKKFYEYVFKHGVRHDDFASDEYPYDKESFEQMLEEEAIDIKCYFGY